MGNLELWGKVKTPDPKFTKTFSRSGGFKGTATNTQYQIMTATEMWGPNGTGWGYEITDEKYIEGAPLLKRREDGTSEILGNEIIHVVRGYVWYIDQHGAKCQTSEHFGQTTFVGSNKNGFFTDEEAPKKSVTDMLLKCLALLGFSADIFLGLYDDHKYVALIRDKYEDEKKYITEAQIKDIRDVLAKGKEYTEKVFVDSAKIESLEKLEAHRFDNALKHIKSKVDAENKGA